MFLPWEREFQMHPTPYKSLYRFLGLSLTISITLPCILCSFPVDSRYANCSQPFKCGDISVLADLKYPFWGINRASYCGKHGFELKCVNNTPVISISTIDLLIIGTNPHSHKITVLFKEFWGNLCPSAVFKKTKDTRAYQSLLSIDYGSVFTNSTMRFVTILYGCPSELGHQLGWLGRDSCRINNTIIDVHFVTHTVDFSNTSECKGAISLPIPQENAQALDEGAITLLKAIDEGFDMYWWLPLEDDKCKACVGSGGQCGNNSALAQPQFTCYCPDKPYALYCPQSLSGKKNKTGIVVGISVGVVLGLLLLLLGGGWILVRKRQKKLNEQDKSRGIYPTPVSSKDGGGPPASNPGSNGLTSSAYTTSTYSHSNASYMSSRSEIGKSYNFGVHVFDYTELEIATNNFDESKELGDGGFGTVYYGVLRDGRCVAVKRLYENSAKRKEQFKNEIKILADLEHKNLVRLYGCTSSSSRELLLVYEYIANGTVAEHLHGKFSESTFLRWPTRLNIAVETAEALAFLHRKDVIHRDVKTTNILLDEGFHVKVADFGLSRLFPTNMTHVSTAPQGTPGYVDPEYYQCYRLTEKSDVYSFGVVLIELISSKLAVDITRHRHDVNLSSMAVDRIQNQALHELVDPRLEFDVDPTVQAMVRMVAELGFQCLQPDREMRPTMDEVVARLRAVQLEGVKGQKQEVLDIVVYGDDVGLLNNPTPPLSPHLSSSNDAV